MSSPAPACLRALADATARWPLRDRRSDGIMGDQRHQAKPSDHNLGNAFDIDHDPDHGVDIAELADLALTDPRTKYVIRNGEIWNASIVAAWRPYKGDNQHRHHMHVSIHASMRDDVSPWPWSPLRQTDRPRGCSLT